MKIGETKSELISIIQGVCTKNIRTYCWLSRDKMLILLKLFFNKTISLSALDKHLADLNRIKFTYSYPRKAQREDGTWYNLPTNRALTKKCIFYLLKHGKKVAKWLVTWAKKKILPTAERKSYNLSRLYKEKDLKPGTLSEDLQKWMKTPGLKLDLLKQPG